MIEVDAASRTKVEETRALLENLHYAPHVGRHKIYLIDEVHMLSKHSFNALLKTIEEPPAHVKFIFATTDPQKIPATVISRCLQFHLRLVGLDTLKQHLTDILKQESIPAQESAIAMISQAATGSVRDALSLLDQAIAYGNGSLESTQIQKMLGLSSHNQIGAILQALQEQDCQTLLQTAGDIIAQGVDSKQLLDQLLCELHQLAIASTLANTGLDKTTIIQATSKDSEQWMQWFSPQQIQIYYQTALIGKRDIELAPSPAMGLEMVLLRMLAFARHRVLPTDGNTPAQNTQSTTYSTPSPVVSDKKQKVSQPAATNPSLNQAKADQSSNASAETNTTASTITPIPLQSWGDGLIEALSLSGAARALAKQCSLVSYQEHHLILQLEPVHKTLLQPSYQKRIEKAISEYCLTPTRVTIQLIDSKSETALATPSQPEIPKANPASQPNQSHENQDIQKIMDRFDAQLIETSS